MKKGQTTLFIILGIIILFAALLTFYLTRPQIDIQEVLEYKGPEGVRNYVEACLKSSAEIGVQLLGVQGGHIYLPESYLTTDYAEVSYNYFERTNLVPSIENMQEELNQFIADATLDCVGDFSAVQGALVKKENITIITLINEDNMVVDANFKLTIDDNTQTNKFTQNLDIRLGKMHEYVNQIVDHTVSDPDWIDFTFLSSFDFSVSMTPLPGNNLLISMTDTETFIQGTDFIYLIALHYKENQPPSLPIPDSFNLTDEVQFFYKVNSIDPEDDPITFEDDHGLFDITQQGVISFVPHIPGSYDVTITVKDNRENVNSKVVTFFVN